MSSFRHEFRTFTRGPEMVAIKGGTFIMGSPEDEPGRFSDEQQHQETVGDFAIGKYPVTFEEYDQFAYATGRPLPSDHGWGRGRRPVMNVSWEDAVAYAQWLSRMTGQPYRLPSEAEWEYACRAGSTTAYHYGNDPSRLGEYAWYSDNADGMTHPVGEKLPNELELYDMHGNVWEWCQDEYMVCDVDAEPEPESSKVVRGGSWSGDARVVRAAVRSQIAPGYRYLRMGLRVVCDPDQD